MEKIKSFEEFIKDETLPSIEDILEDSIIKEKKWDKIMKKDFLDLPVYNKGKDGLKVDLRLDNFHNYEYTKHEPCIYFRVKEGEYGFLPMIISDTPYVPYSFEQTISDEDLLWVCDWVKTNKDTLLKYANEEFGYKTFKSIITNNQVIAKIEEGSAKLQTEDTGLERVIWIGPYGNTRHYLRIKIQYPKGNNNSHSWIPLSIPDLKLITKEKENKIDISSKKLEDIKRFAITNHDCLDKFAKDEIDFQTLQQELQKNKK